MSLAIDIDRVVRVLLKSGWHEVSDASFLIDSYEFIWHGSAKGGEPSLEHGGGESGICATGFMFKDNRGKWIAGPLTSILAVETLGEK